MQSRCRRDAAGSSSLLARGLLPVGHLELTDVFKIDLDRLPSLFEVPGYTIEKANAIDDRPVVIDFRTDYREKVFPMVAAGQSNDDIILPHFQNANRSALR